MKDVFKNNLLLHIVIGTAVFFIVLLYSMNEVSKREHELKMECSNFEASNTPICLKTAYKY